MILPFATHGVYVPPTARSAVRRVWNFALTRQQHCGMTHPCVVYVGRPTSPPTRRPARRGASGKSAVSSVQQSSSLEVYISTSRNSSRCVRALCTQQRRRSTSPHIRLSSFCGVLHWKRPDWNSIDDDLLLHPKDVAMRERFFERQRAEYVSIFS